MFLQHIENPSCILYGSKDRGSVISSVIFEIIQANFETRNETRPHEKPSLQGAKQVNI